MTALLTPLARPLWHWPVFAVWVFLFRLPHLLLAPNRFDGDSAHHWLVMEYNLAGAGPYLQPFGSDHMGITEFLLSWIFLPFLGHTPAAYELGLTVAFLIFAAGVYLVTRQHYGNRAACASLLLLALPSPLISFLSVRAYGGHVLSMGMALVALWYAVRTIRGKGALWHWVILGILCGLTLYTHRLAAIVLAGSLVYAVLLHWKREKLVVSIGRAAFLGTGFLIGVIPIYLAARLRPMEVGYKVPFVFSLENLQSNIHALVTTMIPVALDAVYMPGIEEGGFRPDKGLRSIISFWQILILLLALPPGWVVIQRLIGVLRGRIAPTYGVFFLAVLGINTLSVLVTSIPMNASQMVSNPLLRALIASNDTTLPMAMRFFLPVAAVVPPLLAALLAGQYATPRLRGKMRVVKFKAPVLYAAGHFLIYILAYGRGYMPGAPMYTVEGAPGASRITEVLQARGVKRCVANFWVAYPIMLMSKKQITANPVHWIPDLSISRHPEFERQIASNPEGIECIIQNPMLLPPEFRGNPAQIHYATRINGQPVQMTFSVLHRELISGWDVILVKESPASVSGRLSQL
jgi:hypothetical protein